MVGIDVDARLQRITLSLSGEAAAGPWILHLAFQGTMNDKLRGFYRSTYTDEDGQEHTIATTQFEAADARRAFPCWDEPDLKAVFGITLVVARGARRDLQRPRDRAGAVLDDGPSACGSPTRCRCRRTSWRSWWAVWS